MGVSFTHFTLRTQQSPLFHMTVLFPHFTLRTQYSPLFQTFCKPRSHIILILRFICNFSFFLKLIECKNTMTQQKCPINSRIAKLLQTFLLMWDKPAHESSQLSPAMQDRHYVNFIPPCGYYLILFPNTNARIGSHSIINFRINPNIPCDTCLIRRWSKQPCMTYHNFD